MTEQFDLRKFMLEGGIIYVPNQHQWTETFSILEDHGFEANFNFRKIHNGAYDYPWIVYRDFNKKVSAYSNNWSGLSSRFTRINYDELCALLDNTAVGPPAQPEEILSMLYKEAET